jgi:hypothetical protein
MDLLILTDRQTPRVDYIFTQIFERILNLKFFVTLSQSEFNSFKGPKIAYSSGNFSNAINVKPCGLLFDSNIEEQKMAFFKWKDLPAFFPVPDASDIPFDLFAASFYLITRYEEYLPFTPDTHGRFPAYESNAYQMGFLERPLVDLWVRELKEMLIIKFSDLKIEPNRFELIPTIDIDNAYAYKHKGFGKAMLGTIRAISLFRLAEVIARMLAYLNLSRDPYNTYAKLFRILKHFPITKWFVLSGGRGQWDRNLPVSSKPMGRLLKRIASHFEVGIHPSYFAGSNVDKINIEIDALEKVIEKKIVSSRQHFLVFKTPEYFEALNKLHIKFDYSMGYSNVVGYRASTCTPFNLYNLHSETELSVKIFPFAIMDRALHNRSKGSPAKAVIDSINMIQEVKTLGGTFILAWHNETLSGIYEWRGWERVLTEILASIKNH